MNAPGRGGASQPPDGQTRASVAATVVVTRPQPQAGEWVAALLAHGLRAWAFPLIEIRAPRDAAALHRAWTMLAHGQSPWHAVMFVSGAAVTAFFREKPPEIPVESAWDATDLQAWATGPGTAEALRRLGWPLHRVRQPDPEGTRFDSEALWQQVGQDLGRGRVLIVQGADARGQPSGRDWLGARLVEAGVAVDRVSAYERHRPQPAAALRQRAVDAAGDGSWWLLSSAEAALALPELLPDLPPGRAWHRARALTTHPRIAQVARDIGFGRVQTTAPRLPDIIASIKSFA